MVQDPQECASLGRLGIRHGHGESGQGRAVGRTAKGAGGEVGAGGSAGRPAAQGVRRRRPSGGGARSGRPGAEGGSSEVQALTAMGLGSRRAPGSPALLLLLLLPPRLLWQVWGAETLRGECESAPRGRLRHCQGMERWDKAGRVWEAAPGTCPGILAFTWDRPDLHTPPSCHCAHDKAEWQGPLPLSSRPALKPLCLGSQAGAASRPVLQWEHPCTCIP